jgi:hypothetical protein
MPRMNLNAVSWRLTDCCNVQVNYLVSIVRISKFLWCWLKYFKTIFKHLEEDCRITWFLYSTLIFDISWGQHLAFRGHVKFCVLWCVYQNVFWIFFVLSTIDVSIENKNLLPEGNKLTSLNNSLQWRLFTACSYCNDFVGC